MKTLQTFVVAVSLGVAAASWAQSEPAASVVTPGGDDVASVKARLGNARMSPKQRAMIANAEAAQANEQAAPAFLEVNRKRPGVKTLAGGIQYRVLVNGKGKPAGAVPQGLVRVRYVAHLVDGTTFDRVDEKQGTVLNVAGLVPGLGRALREMPVGAKWEVVVPPQLGYGARGYRSVAPNSVLIYDVELLGLG